jgi:predicted ATPase/class 3 adenylate cyclase
MPFLLPFHFCRTPEYDNACSNALHAMTPFLALCSPEGLGMDFYALLDQIIILLRRRGRVSYRALKLQFQLDDDQLEALKDELIKAQRLAVDEDDAVLVWAGEAASAPPSTTVQVPSITIPPHLTEKIYTSRAALEGERKQVTVLFADIKDSTELIRGLDPEAAQQLLDPTLHYMMDAVHRFEGTVNQVLGDGIMALFGAPIAHEDHALRACYAALAMQAALRSYTEEVRRTHGLELRIRVGLNSGEVVVRTIGNDLHMDYSAVGETTHLAARMEQLATPGSIRLAATTLRLVEGLVQVNALGLVPVKGVPEPVEVFELVGTSGLRRRLQAAVARGLTRFVGRDTELDTLWQALTRAQAGHGQVVALVGEAGVGKSRLVYEFVHSHRTHSWLILESASVSYGKATPYFPVIDLLKRYARVEEVDDTRTIRARLTGQVFTLDDTLQDTVPALLALLGAVPDDSPFLQLDPQQRRQRTLDALKRLLLREGQEQPLLLVFEDLHWIDTETQALLDSLVESLPAVRLLLLVNYRPEYQHAWGSKTYYTQLRLDPLPRASAEGFLHALLGDGVGTQHAASLQALKQVLIERTGGNPFFLEESVRALVETGVLVGTTGAYHLVQEIPSIQVPTTVQAVLAARIDRLPPDEKHLLQTASVIGTEVVPLALLQALAELSEEALQRGLAHLQAAEFLYETRLFPEREFTFKHALTHEVAYGSMLQSQRRFLHARIVEALEARGGDRLAEQVERIAYHALRAEVWEKALLYLRQAGNRAMARSAAREAQTYFEQALEALTHLPENRDLIEHAIDLRLELSGSQTLLDTSRRIENLREAERLAEHLTDHHRLGRICSAQAHHFFMVGDHDRALEACERTLALAREDVSLQHVSNFTLGNVYYALGEYRRAMHVLRKSLEAMQGGQAHEHLRSSTGSLAVHTRARLVWCLLEVGEFAEGMVTGEEALRMAEEADYPFSRVIASLCVGVLSLRKGALHRAIPMLERGVTLCQSLHIPPWYPAIASALACAYALGSRTPDALPLLEYGLKWATSGQIIVFRVFTLLCQSETAFRTERHEDAHVLAVSALTLARDHKERGHEAWILRLLGDIAARRDPPEIGPAETHYQQALALAEELGMRPIQAHCHLGLGTLYARGDQREQACMELYAAIDLYRAMDMAFWLPQAQAALAQVG